MQKPTRRRDFLKAAPIAAAVVSNSTPGNAEIDASRSGDRLDTLRYQGVKLRDSFWQRQYQGAREYYLAVPDDDILKGFRTAAGKPAPGKTLGGWCERDSSTVFGQWLSGMSRMYRATGDTQIRDKANYLFEEWSKTIGDNGDARMRHYPYEKLVCGLVDMKLYADQNRAIDMLVKVTDHAGKTFNRDRIPAAPKPWEMHSGRPLEWYTLPENLYRAYQVSGEKSFKDFADIWLYQSYWGKFENTALPVDAHGVHAYSHVNSFNSAAMAYEVTRDLRYLQILKNAYDYLQNTQCYATGGYGPVERILPPNGNLGKALEYQMNSCEAPCCSWAGLKLSSYLTRFTGESRYGDWAEKLIYNCIGAALPITGHGKHFYYADYRVGAGVKLYSRNAYTCCSGSYIQNVADYHNQIYYKDADSLLVNLYLPSEVTWRRGSEEIKLTQETKYPEGETVSFTLETQQPTRFPLKFRVPGWSRDVSAKVNGAATNVSYTPGTWGTLDRTWTSGDKVELRIPLTMRMSAVDPQHPKRVAILRGPVVMVQEGNVHEPIFRLPESDEELNKWLVPDKAAGYFRLVPPDGQNVIAKFQPFYSVIESLYYRMYFDLDKLPVVLWS